MPTIPFDILLNTFELPSPSPPVQTNASVVYWPPTPPNMRFQRRRKCIFHWCGRASLTIGDRVKIPRYSRRLMHRKRMTCELHDSYFRLITIKHAIPKTAEVIHSDGQLWGDIEWAIEQLYNSVKTGSLLVWESEELEKWWWRKIAPSRELGSWTSGWAAPGELERNADGHKSGGQYVAVMFGLQLPLTVKPWVTLSNPFNKVRGIFF